MAFESGSLSFRMFYLPGELPDTLHEQFADDVLGSIDHLLDEELHGWVGPRHLLDREIHEGTVWPSGFLRLTLCQAQRKIPASLLRAECRIEEMVWMQAEHRDYVNRQQKSEIKQQVIERLLPQMPPQLKGIDLCGDPRTKTLYASALSDKQLDAFLLNFGKTTGIKLVPVDPVSAAWSEASCRADQWPRWGFAAEQWADCAPGREFLMWLWFMSEAKGGEVNLPDGGTFAVLVEGPLLFDQEEQGETAIRKGEPMVSAETRAALLSGKKLRRAKLTLARGGEEVWTCTLDADSFVVRSLKLPKTEAIDAAGRFQERMEMVDTFRLVFLGLYSTFCKLRDDETSCKALDGEMREWMASRPSRKLMED
ncbi:MAG: recombination-associated protein RdgC [Kiritimatiellales bacterium]